MKRFFPSPAFLLAIALFAGAVQTDARAQATYDYEAVTNGGMSFATDRATFNLSGHFNGVIATDFGSTPGLSDGYMDTVFGQARTGVVGGLSVQEGYTFRLVTLDVWPSADQGGNVMTPGESIRVIGKKDGVFVASGDFTTTDLNQSPAPTGGSWQQITISGALATADIDAFEIELLGTQNYIAVDNFTYSHVGADNTAPVATAPSSPVVTEDAGPVVLADDIQLADDDGDDQTVTFTITGGMLEIGTAGITFGGGGNGSASFTASGTLAAVNTALDAATFTPAANVNGVNAGTISFVSNDGTSNSNTASVTFDIAAVNDNPTMTGLPSEITFTEDIGDALDLSAATLSDVDAGSSSITLTLMVSSGVIWGAHALPNDGYGTGTVTQTGSVSALNDFLDTYGWLYYEPETNVYGDNAAVLEIFVNDNGNSGSGGGGNVALGTVDIRLTAVPDEPSITAATTDEDVQTTSGLVVTRSAADGAEVTHFKVTSIVGGTLFLSDGATAVSTGDFITAADGGAGLRFTPTPNRTEAGSVTVRASTSADDSGLGGTAATATVTINAVNDAPEVVKLIEFADPSILEDGSAEFGALNGKFIAVQDVDAGTNDIEVTISAPSSTVSLTSVAGVTFTTGDGASDETMVFTGTVAEVNDVLTSGITYAPDPDEHDDLGFTISVDDGGYTGSGGAKIGSLTLDMPVYPINDAPVFTTGADQELDEDAGAQSVAGWATDIDAGAANEADQELTFNVTNDNNGLFAAQPAVSAAGTLTFTPAENAFGEATVTVVLTDDGGNVAPSDDDSDPQTFTITVNSVNDPPVVTVPDTQTTLEETPIELSVENGNAITVSDVDLGKNVLDVTLTAGSTVQLGSTEWLNITGGADGTNMVSFSGSTADINAALDGLVYTPSFGATSGTLTIAVSDGVDESVEQVSFTITQVNDRPVAADDAATTPEDTPALIDVLANDADEDGDELQVVIDTEPAHGTVLVGGDGIVTYSPGANFSGQDTFTYIAQDPSLDFASATVTVTVTQVNDAPVALDDAASTTEGAAVTIDVLANDSDIESTLTVTAVGDPAHGSASINQDGSVEYAPEAGFAGTDTFTYTVSDGEIEAGAEVSVTVESTNAAPVASDDAASAPHGGSVTIDLLANDTDPDGDEISVSAVDAPSDGTLTDNGDGTITCAPAADADGDITFTYTISDPDGETDSALVTITVAGVSSDGDGVADGVEDGAPNDGDGNGDGINDGAQENVASLPVAAGPNTGEYVTVAAPEGTMLSGVQSTQNPSPDDFPADAVNPAGFLDFRVTGLSAGASTQVWIHLPPGATATGYLKYGPTPDDPTPHWYDFGYDGETGALIIGNRILLLLKDGARGDDDLTANGVIVDPGMPVLGLNSAPVAAPDTATLPEDGSVEIDVLANDTDADGDSLYIQGIEAPVNGNAQITDDGLIRYTPPADWFGEIQMLYLISDTSGVTSDAVIDITVEPVQDAPVAVDDVAETEEDQPVRIDIFSNDVDVDGDAFHLTSQDDPNHGTSVYHYDGSVTYTPDPDFTGTDSWTYTISDGPENSGEIVFGTITVTVTAVGDAPRFADGNVVDLPSDGSVVVAESDAAFTAAVQTATDPDGDLLAYEWHVAADEAFTDVLFMYDVENASDMQLAPAAESLIEALEPAGLSTGTELTVFHRVRATDATGAETWSDVQQTTFARSAVSTSNEQSSDVPDEFRLEGNYPNPFNPSTTVAFGLPETAHVTLAVYDITGKRVRLLVDGMRPAGTYRHLVRMDDLPSGVYMYRLVTPEGQITRMMHLLK